MDCDKLLKEQYSSAVKTVFGTECVKLPARYIKRLNTNIMNKSEVREITDNRIQKLKSKRPFLIQSSVDLPLLSKRIGNLPITDDILPKIDQILGSVNHIDVEPMSTKPVHISEVLLDQKRYRTQVWQVNGTLSDGRFLCYKLSRISLFGASLFHLRVEIFIKEVGDAKWSTNMCIDIPESISGETTFNNDGVLSISVEDLGENTKYLFKSTQYTFFPIFMHIPNLDLDLELSANLPYQTNKSNAAIILTDGIGLKSVIYPDISGSVLNTSGQSLSFKGMFTKLWESGVHPLGFSSSLSLRSIINIEKSLGLNVNPFIDLSLLSFRMKDEREDKKALSFYIAFTPDGNSVMCLTTQLGVKQKSVRVKENSFVYNNITYTFEKNECSSLRTHLSTPICYVLITTSENKYGSGILQRLPNQKELEEEQQNMESLFSLKKGERIYTSDDTNAIALSWILWITASLVVLILLFVNGYMIYLRVKHKDNVMVNNHSSHNFFRSIH